MLALAERNGRRMTSKEKRAAILEMATPTLLYFGEVRALDLLKHGSDALIEYAWARFFEQAWRSRTASGVDEGGVRA